MALLYPLCSSSKGNCTYIGDKSAGILIDAGIGIRDFTSLLKFHDIDISAVKAIFITHEHQDHIKGLKRITSQINAPVFGTRETLEQIILKNAVSEKSDLYEINKKPKTVAGCEIKAFDTPHDSAHSVGYSVNTFDYKKISLCTDLGYIPASVSAAVTGSDAVVIESNFDAEMLVNGPYPPILKQRIQGKRGHISNDDCAWEIKRLFDEGTRKFILAHLSEENNRPEIAYKTVSEYLRTFGIVPENDCHLAVAPKKSIGRVFEV